MPVNVSEVQENLAKYITLAATEDILITQGDQVVATLTSPQRDRIKTAKSLFGILPQTTTWEEARAERFIHAPDEFAGQFL